MSRFTLPRDIYHGKGALEALKTFEGKRAIICTGGGSMKRGGFLQKVEEYLKEAGMDPVRDPVNQERLQELAVLRKRIGPTAELALRPIVDRNQVNRWALTNLV